MESEAQQDGNVISPYASPMYNFGSSIIHLTNPENELYKMELTFRSQIEDREGNIRNTGEPLMNDLGISNVMGSIQCRVNQVTIMGNLDKPEIAIHMELLADELARDLMINRDRYGIRSFAVRDKIFNIAIASAHIAMKRSFQEGDRRFWKGSVQEIHNRIDNPNSKKGLLGGLLSWNKNG